MELTVAALGRLDAPPPSWYLLGRARDVSGRKPKRVQLCGQDLVLFRSSSGVAALGARCPHMGADLARGTVREGRLTCPFHAWEFGPHGRCQRIPGLDDVPAFAKVPALTVRERHGLVHAFRGATPTFDLPFFAGTDPNAFVVGPPFRIEANCAWYMVGANGFDAQHFANVHGRTAAAAPVVDHPHPAARRVVHQFRITGGALQDVLSRRLWGDRATLSFTSWNGNVIVGTFSVGGFTSYLIIYVQPLSATRCVAEFALYRPRRGLVRRLARPLSMAILRLVTKSFFRHEVDGLGQAHLNPHRLVETDALLRDYMTWLVGRADANAPRPAPRQRASAEA